MVVEETFMFADERVVVVVAEYRADMLLMLEYARSNQSSSCGQVRYSPNTLVPSEPKTRVRDVWTKEGRLF